MAPAALAPAWPHENSDVPRDPAIRYGKLANGMRYAIRRNLTPPGQAVVRLRIDAGSLAEHDNQLGLAHFLEHMVFNGTKNVPEGEFVHRLERLGLAFGADTNASTGFDETIYSLDLPNTRKDVIDTAMLLMRETAGEVLFDSAAIDRERGVVLSQERMGANANARAGEAQIAFVMDGQLPSKRRPIGSVDIISHAQRERFLEFYNAYYRPENATLVVVGDVDVDAMERQIRDRFGDWQGKGPAGPRPVLGALAPRGQQVKIFDEPGVPSAVQIAWNSPPELNRDSRAQRQLDLRKQLVMAVIKRRLALRAQDDDPPFITTNAETGTTLKAVNQAGVGAEFRRGGWRRALEALDQEQRRASQYGITQPELDRQVSDMRRALENALAAADTRGSGALANDILNALSRDDVVTTPADRLAAFEATARTFDAAQASAIARDIFKGDGPLVFLVSPEPIQGGEAAVGQVLDASRRVAVAPPSGAVAKQWPYASFGPPGRVVERREVADLNTTFVRFANGVRLTVRPSRNERNNVFVATRMGHGTRDLPYDRPNYSWAARQALIGGGLGKLSPKEIDDALAGKTYGAGIEIGEEYITLSGSTRPVDLATELEVLTAFATDPGWRPQALQRSKAALIDQYAQYDASPAGVMGRDLPRLLRAGDPRFGVPALDFMLATTTAGVRKVLQPVSSAPIEVTIVGDISVDDAIQQTAATFGTLPPRKEVPVSARAIRARFPAGQPTPVRLTHRGRGDQAMAFIAWPTGDYWADPQRSRTLDVLTAIMRLRLTDQVREKEAITYSPSAANQESGSYPGYGYVAAAIETPPARLDTFFADALTIVRSLRDTPVTADELNRAVGPKVASLIQQREYNGYWASVLAHAQQDPRRLDVIRDAVPGLRRVTAADVQRVAKEYLRDDRAFRLIVVPEVKVKAMSE